MACSFPFMVKNKHPTKNDGYANVPVPCGKCYDCKMRAASQWSLRLLNEDKVSDSAHFVTLTYSDEFLPLSKNQIPTLKLDDVQKYFKRLRKVCNTIKYFLVGEYGTKRQRPHYHIILFNADLRSIVEMWTHPVSKLPLGEVHIGNVTGASIAYCLKYMMKESSMKKRKFDDRKKEFRTMSKGLGINYLTSEMVAYHRQDVQLVYATIDGGIKVPLPRYYRERIWTEKELEVQKIELVKRFKQQQQQQLKKDENFIEKQQRGAQVRNERSAKNASNRSTD